MEKVIVMNDESFARLVAEEVKQKASPYQRSFLRQEENRERWIEALETLITNLDGQVVDLDRQEKAEIRRFETLGRDAHQLIHEYKVGVEQRRRKIARFRFHVETRLDEVRRLSVVGSASPEERGRALDFYRSAIVKHKEEILAQDLDYSEVDEALWATLAGKWLFGLIDEPTADNSEQE